MIARHLFRKKTTLRWVAAIAAALSTASVETRGAAPKPNVILIVADDLGWADLGCYGSSFHRTPTLDRLAIEGGRFTNAYAAGPVCSPSRAALLTGKWPARLHLTDWLPGRPDMPSQKLKRPVIQNKLPLEEVTVAEVLKASGYATASIGKWHLGGSGFEPTRQGFDLNIAGDASGSPLSYFAPFARDERKLPGLEAAESGEYLTDRLATEAVKFIREHQQQPFFLYLPHFAVHIPLAAPNELVSQYPAAEKFAGKQNNPIYAAMLQALDQGVARIQQTLDELNLADRTVLIFTSDNGGLATLEGPNTPATSNAPYREGKGFLYEGGIRVPLVVKWPGKTPPSFVCHVPVSGIDVPPTILEICGVQSAEAKFDGVSLVPLLKGSQSLDRNALYWHYPHYSNQGGKPGGAIREGDWKLIEYFESGRRELFRIGSDSSEGQNWIDQEPEVAQRLGEKLARWRHDVGAQMPTENPDYVPNPQSKDGHVVLPAQTANVHGVMRYEPMPHKNTLGYWVQREDWADWEFTITRPGRFDVELLQGCGNGSGGSQVEVRVADESLKMTVQETGGFQNFVPRTIGTIEVDHAGRHTLSVKAQTKPGVAVMDLRQITLKPVAR